jgi:hypothetical protein
MDPISTAILAAITAGLTAGTQDTVKSVVGDLYTGLKGLVQRKAGQNAASVQTINLIESNPDVDGFKTTLPAILEKDGITGDAEILAAAEKLLSEVQKTDPQAITNVQTVIGQNNAVAGPGGHASVSVNMDRKKN